MLALVCCACNTVRGGALHASSLICLAHTMVGTCAVQAWHWQQQLVAEAREHASDPAEACDDTLVLLQHDPVYTLGDVLTTSSTRSTLTAMPYVTPPH